MKYLVIGYVDCTVCEEVEASSPEEAADKVGCHSPSVCYQCSKEMSVGDVYKVEVQDSDTGEILWSDG